MNKLNKTGGKCFFLGSSQDTLDKIVAKAKMEFPKIQVEVFSPPYKPTFSEEENAEMISRVNAYNPDVLFVGMTAPKQEKWAYTHYDKLNINAHIGSIGAVFDFYAGTVDRPSPFWINLGLEWFIRLIKEPKRMWKRYLYYGPIFIKMIVEQKLKQLFKI
jgi:N-acetylglucosaminyldiphosphoundecaprenol N-acetyl-beta-D-mannosaminyltransferase